MEKQTAEERKRQWQWHTTDAAHETFNKAFLEASCWPCGFYSRASSRLRSALTGHNADKIPDQGCCNPECAQFALCLPFYGCFIARLQTTVRAFYNIDGSDTSDWYDGCCCPCLTLIRNENEILLREKQHMRLKDLHEPGTSLASPYCSQAPMTSGNSNFQTTASSAHSCVSPSGLEKDFKNRAVVGAASKGKDAAQQQGAAATEAMLRGGANEASPQRPVPVAASLVGRHSLTQDQLTALGVPPMIHELQPSPESTPQKKSTAHLLEHDTVTPATIFGAAHRLSRDFKSAQASSSPKHKLAEDRVGKTDTPRVSHELKDDATTAVKDVSGPKHSIGANQPVKVASGENAHALRDDSMTMSAGDSSTAHVLKDDAKTDSGVKDLKHELTVDKETRTGASMGKTHQLEGR
ncbi:hypothetical protein HIM_09345 [Hirsutella minnesotensis 3608]|uniref:Uncharacterized protein n=1 Tax=Hirsutella minnesotensis 3608 TaxID=1043627 RepID=A0A0F7ZXT3_9HYPO|nr:hypothetical protein HIM_09345 [Hirsutella minnesotensis 3608]